MKTFKIQYFLRGNLMFTYEGYMRGSNFYGYDTVYGCKVKLKNPVFVENATSEPAIQFVKA